HCSFAVSPAMCGFSPSPPLRWTMSDNTQGSSLSPSQGTPFLAAIRSGRILLMDGAMGTELQRAGLQSDECAANWNLIHPDRVRAIHQSYVDAGAEVLVTNTFQANPPALAWFGLDTQFERIFRAGIELARSISGCPFVVVSIGPIPLEDDLNLFKKL